MCKPYEAYLRVLDWIDKHPITFTMLAGFVAGGIAVWHVGNIFERNNEQMMTLMEKQTVVQLETAKALQELSVRQAETNGRLSSLESEVRRKTSH